jgi:hypothetical protein
VTYVGQGDDAHVSITNFVTYDANLIIKKRGSSEAFEEPPEKVLKTENGTRKSQRHRKVRGEKEVKVKSSQTLKDFKLQLCIFEINK